PKRVLPDAVRESTVDGARATVEYFWAAVDYGRMTGDTQHAAQVAHYVCESCNQLIYKGEKIYEDNAWADLHEATEITVLEVQENLMPNEKKTGRLSFSKCKNRPTTFTRMVCWTKTSVLRPRHLLAGGSR